MRAIDKAPKEVQEAMNYILDIFGGGDGGGGFYNFCLLIQSLSDQAKEKPEAVNQLFNVIIRFERLIRAAQPK